jgi:hypothetical protein
MASGEREQNKFFRCHGNENPPQIFRNITQLLNAAKRLRQPVFESSSPGIFENIEE